MQVDYAVGEIVWAKIVGYPWWPATVLFALFRSAASCRAFRAPVKTTSSSSSARTRSTFSLISQQHPELVEARQVRREQGRLRQEGRRLQVAEGGHRSRREHRDGEIFHRA